MNIPLFLYVYQKINVKDFCCCVVAFISQETLFRQKNVHVFFCRRRSEQKILPEVQQELQDQQIEYMMYMTDSNKNTQQIDHFWVQDFRQNQFVCDSKLRLRIM